MRRIVFALTASVLLSGCLLLPAATGDGFRWRVEPATAVPYCDRTKTFRGKIDRQDLCYRLFTARGFTWGGNWRTLKDWQHFEK